MSTFEEVDAKLPEHTKEFLKSLPSEQKVLFLDDLNAKEPSFRAFAIMQNHNLTIEEVRLWCNKALGQ